MREIRRKSQRGGGDGCGESGEERGPSGHEAPHGSEGLGEVNILAAGTGEVDPELGVTHRSQKGANAADGVDPQDEVGGTELRCKKSGAGKDTGADHVRD